MSFTNHQQLDTAIRGSPLARLVSIIVTYFPLSYLPTTTLYIACHTSHHMSEHTARAGWPYEALNPAYHYLHTSYSWRDSLVENCIKWNDYTIEWQQSIPSIALYSDSDSDSDTLDELISYLLLHFLTSYTWLPTCTRFSRLSNTL